MKRSLGDNQLNQASPQSLPPTEARQELTVRMREAWEQQKQVLLATEEKLKTTEALLHETQRLLAATNMASFAVYSYWIEQCEKLKQELANTQETNKNLTSQLNVVQD